MASRNLYYLEGSLERNLAGMDLLYERFQDEEAICVHRPYFENRGAIVYAERNSLDEIDRDAASEYGLEVYRRGTGGSPFLWRPSDLVLTVSSGLDILADYLGPAIKNTFEELEVQGNLEVKDDSERRAVWLDGRPVSSFSSKDMSGFLSGYVGFQGYDVEMLDEILDLRPGEKEYISEIPDFRFGADEFLDVFVEQIDAERSDFTVSDERFLDRAEESYEEELSDEEGAEHRGLCQVFWKDL